MGGARPLSRQRAILVRARETTKADNIGRKDRSEFPAFGHSPPPHARRPVRYRAASPGTIQQPKGKF
jgi:hypothetical protein